MKDLVEKYLNEERTDPAVVKELKDVIEFNTRFHFSDPKPFRSSSIVKFSRMSSRLPSDAMAFEYKDRLAVVVSGNHTYVIDDSDNDVRGPFAIYDTDKLTDAVLDADCD